MSETQQEVEPAWTSAVIDGDEVQLADDQSDEADVSLEDLEADE